MVTSPENRKAPAATTIRREAPTTDTQQIINPERGPDDRHAANNQPGERPRQTDNPIRKAQPTDRQTDSPKRKAQPTDRQTDNPKRKAQTTDRQPEEEGPDDRQTTRRGRPNRQTDRQPEEEGPESRIKDIGNPCMKSCRYNTPTHARREAHATIRQERNVSSVAPTDRAIETLSRIGAFQSPRPLIANGTDLSLGDLTVRPHHRSLVP